ncbi:TonB-dependent receptor plug domain-containing protein [Aureivirga sp. CE67]|uniref:TonB-dependent receptor plug domain-containing protein n=1 Tax=Aureivirga sp. CE67 TaxID=1788983 RepID=UPI001E5F0EC6|nr:TonB-dependent receptor [Aureivirga sp. CE67]
MKAIVSIFLLLGCFYTSFSQEQEFSKDSIIELDDVIVIGKRKFNHQRYEKPLASLDEYLEKSRKVSMIKRGNYAWEPTLNSMTSDRLSITIDGMQIFGACTDKMDPITSYVDISNLNELQIHSGQKGTEFSNAIGGGINMQLKKGKFIGTGFGGAIDLGYETNGNGKTTGAELDYFGDKFYFKANGMYRDYDNYDAGGNKEILYSQYKKYNIAINTGVQTSENGVLDATFIYDEANDVGYPALPMDVSLAKALISSLNYTHKYDREEGILSWETKAYYNTITHIMDDSARPNLQVRMDMPGWSSTYGAYFKLKGKKGKHNWLVNANTFYNRAEAEMTMYVDGQIPMYMVTWPDLRTFDKGIYGEDIYQINKNSSLQFTGRIAHHTNEIKDEQGFKSLEIFYPGLEKTRNQMLFSSGVNYTLNKNNFTWNLGAAYGERAANTSEGYGFFLFNSYDNFDYIGNSDLAKEKSVELNFKTVYEKNKFSLGFEASGFQIYDYIIGVVDEDLSPMTLGANGVKRYTSLEYANLFNASIFTKIPLYKGLDWEGNITYSYGADNDGKALPLISPISMKSKFSYQYKKLGLEFLTKANTDQVRFNEAYGESQTKGFVVFDLNTSYNLKIKEQNIFLKAGIENIFDKEYTTFADWNSIPRKGRSFFMNISYKF